MYKNVKELSQNWVDDPNFHKHVHESFIEQVNQHPNLKAYRDFVENNVFGFGERSFLWMWWMLVAEMPKKFTFLEIGVFKGQVLGLIELIATLQGKEAIRYGITPLDSSGGVWESDYAKDILTIHEQFNLPTNYKLIVGDSTDAKVIDEAEPLILDILYIDGGHTYGIAASDIVNYSHLVKDGGYLVIDDCANDLHMPWGYFQGIQEVTDAVKDHVTHEFEFLFNVVHNKVWRKIHE
jgi:Methyltransferase domain